MTNAVVLGAGLMGSAAAFDLLSAEEVSAVKIIDSNRPRIDSLKRHWTSDKLSTEVCDVSRDHYRLAKAIRGFDVCIGAVPHQFTVGAIRSAAQAGVDYVDLIFMWRYDRDLWRKTDRLFRNHDSVLVSPCGLAPGLTNVLAARACASLENVDVLKIYTGGLPLRPSGPLGYVLLWSLDDLWEMYTRESIIVDHGKVRRVKPLSGLEYLKIQDVGRLEAFYTDGLSTLVSTLKGVKCMWEKTLRYPGHADRIRTLEECGMLATQPIGHGVEMSPREILNLVVGPKLVGRKTTRDVTVGRVEATGSVNGEMVSQRYDLIDHSDVRNGISSLARTTAYVASVAAQMIARGELEGTGFLPPELALGGTCFDRFMERLRNRGIRITHRTIRRGKVH